MYLTIYVYVMTARSSHNHHWKHPGVSLFTALRAAQATISEFALLFTTTAHACRPHVIFV
jgi:hypothetical protein